MILVDVLFFKDPDPPFFADLGARKVPDHLDPEHCQKAHSFISRVGVQFDSPILSWGFC